PEKIVLSLHKFPIFFFPDDDIEERNFRWVDKCVKRFNPYAGYNVEHWKNQHAKIFYIKRQKEPQKTKEEIYSSSKIAQFIKTSSKLGHENNIVSITKPDYKNLNKNDTKDMYLLIVNEKVDDYIETGLLWSFTEKYKMFSIVPEPMYGIIYNNSKKENRVPRHQEIHTFCDATLKRVFKGSKSYNNNVKHGYVTPNLSKEDVEYLKLFEEEIEDEFVDKNNA
nr:hypothetical protein [Tanacetum cinerariifolium]